MVGITGTYAHLWLVAYLRTSEAVNTSEVLLRFNADASAAYWWQYLDGNGTVASAASGTSATSASIGVCPGDAAAATEFGSLHCQIPNYANTTSRKQLDADSTSIGATTVRRANGALWTSIAAVNRLTLMPGAGNFKAGSRVTVYGLGA
jgi:hypothetical protein